MGLVRFFRENEKKKAKAEKRMVGTTDYLAPEQVVDSDEVDIRADIYGLGATFYFLLTGKTPFEDQSIAHQKLISHLARSPKPILQNVKMVAEKGVTTLLATDLEVGIQMLRSSIRGGIANVRINLPGIKATELRSQYEDMLGPLEQMLKGG